MNEMFMIRSLIIPNLDKPHQLSLSHINSILLIKKDLLSPESQVKWGVNDNEIVLITLNQLNMLRGRLWKC